MNSPLHDHAAQIVELRQKLKAATDMVKRTSNVTTTIGIERARFCTVCGAYLFADREFCVEDNCDLAQFLKCSQ